MAFTLGNEARFGNDGKGTVRLEAYRVKPALPKHVHLNKQGETSLRSLPLLGSGGELLAMATVLNGCLRHDRRRQCPWLAVGLEADC
jgi:hypothetical protein